MTAKFRDFLQPPRAVTDELASLVPGLTFHDSFRGTWKCGFRAASVLLEGDEWLRLSLPSRLEKSPEDALRATATFPGNARFASDGSGVQLVADSRVDGRSHLPASFGELRSLLRSGGRTPRVSDARKGDPLRPRDVHGALSDPSWAEGDVVELESGWEVRALRRDRRVPVRVSITERSVRVHRILSSRWPSDLRARAAALESLRLNAELRLARLALRDSTVQVETTLHSGLVHASWLAVAVRAVVVASEHVTKSLRVLLDDTRVSESYLRVLSS